MFGRKRVFEKKLPASLYYTGNVVLRKCMAHQISQTFLQFDSATSQEEVAAYRANAASPLDYSSELSTLKLFASPPSAQNPCMSS